VAIYFRAIRQETAGIIYAARMANPVYSGGPDFSTMNVFELRSSGYDFLQKFLLFLNGLNYLSEILPSNPAYPNVIPYEKAALETLIFLCQEPYARFALAVKNKTGTILSPLTLSPINPNSWGFLETAVSDLSHFLGLS
jgi:hypothetical protein